MMVRAAALAVGEERFGAHLWCLRKRLCDRCEDEKDGKTENWKDEGECCVTAWSMSDAQAGEGEAEGPPSPARRGSLPGRAETARAGSVAAMPR